MERASIESACCETAEWGYSERAQRATINMPGQHLPPFPFQKGLGKTQHTVIGSTSFRFLMCFRCLAPR